MSYPTDIAPNAEERCGQPTSTEPCPLYYGHSADSDDQDRGTYTGAVCTDPGEIHELAALDARLDRIADQHNHPLDPDDISAADAARAIGARLAGRDRTGEPDYDAAVAKLQAILERRHEPL